MVDQLRQLGAPADVIAATQQRSAAEAQNSMVDVWPDNWHAFSLFLALATQWHWLVGLAGARRAGLRYEAITPVVLAMVRAKVPRSLHQPTPALMQQLQQLEDAALDALAQQRAAKV